MSRVRYTLIATLAGLMSGVGIIIMIIGHPWWAYLIGLVLLVVAALITMSLFAREMDTEPSEETRR
jgi:predicted cobalt transporter CbtA